MAKANPFDYINAINEGRDITRGTENDDLAREGYNPFLANRQFSYFPDTLYVANEMNQRAHLPKQAQFDFLINTVRPRKRFAKWAKPEEQEALEVLIEYYDYSHEKALQVLSIFDKADIAEIKKKLEKGGVKK